MAFNGIPGLPSLSPTQPLQTLAFCLTEWRRIRNNRQEEFQALHYLGQVIIEIRERSRSLPEPATWQLRAINRHLITH